MQVTEERGESGASCRTEAKGMQLSLQSIGQGRFPDTPSSCRVTDPVAGRQIFTRTAASA